MKSSKTVRNKDIIRKELLSLQSDFRILRELELNDNIHTKLEDMSLKLTNVLLTFDEMMYDGGEQ